MDMKTFIEQANNLVSLTFHSSFYRYKSDLTIQNIHSILPPQIKHLRIPINDFDQINSIIQRCKHLVLIQFDIHDKHFSQQVINWFARYTINTTCQQTDGILTVWIGNRIVQSTQICKHHKRIKLNYNN